MQVKNFFRLTDKHNKELWNGLLSHKAFWFVTLFIFGQECTQSLIIFLGAFYSDTPNLPITLAELIILSIAGWALFTFFLRVDSTGLIPSETIRKNRVEQQKLINALYFVPSTRILLRVLLDILTGTEFFKVIGAGLNMYVLLTISLCVSLISGRNLYRLHWKRKSSIRTALSEDPIIYNLSIQNELHKFQSNLTDGEQRELSTLTLYSEKNNRITIINVAKICWTGLFIAWLIDLGIEILQRL